MTLAAASLPEHLVADEHSPQPFILCSKVVPDHVDRIAPAWRESATWTSARISPRSAPPAAPASWISCTSHGNSGWSVKDGPLCHRWAQVACPRVPRWRRTPHAGDVPPADSAHSGGELHAAAASPSTALRDGVSSPGRSRAPRFSWECSRPLSAPTNRAHRCPGRRWCAPRL
jgi:hypothetical protein